MANTTKIDKTQGKIKQILRANLPDYKEVATVPNRDYNNIYIDKVNFAVTINEIFDDTIHWKKHLFLVPSGKARKDFLKLMTDRMQKCNTDCTFQFLAMKVLNTLPKKLLKPSATSKAKDHSLALEQRL